MEIAEFARARTTDPATSHAAAASIADLRASQAAVLAMFIFYGELYDQQLVERYQREEREPMQSESGLRTRRRELCDAGLIERTNRTVRLPSGRKSYVWRLTQDVVR